ncbi:hypothetical protein [Deinococcus sp. RIT780]|uniref:hypothetical protein n=1 Tax=Deinococcus sp. RIT780 TaxID=2870472 RepID=UPI001C89039C|nr:hypothetical protein [Deinococcus sp. RIT780]MBX8467284.1 hypothetical protein [Deinococcus sp. RIT780]
MTLKPPPAKKDKASGPSMLDKNREVEAQQEAQAALVLPPEETIPTGKFTVSPIRLDVLDEFEEVYGKLKKQRRTLKRYQLAEALLASLEDPAVLAAVIQRLK